ncbi:hypothetical protein D6Z43_00210 [Pseudomonas sp. DY-1]|nr:hypothetical protein D6Z43_00210 [Pseudomonas sp. DY-1]
MNDFAAHKDDIEGFLADADPGNPESPQLQVPSFIDSGARWLPSGTCPADQSLNLQTLGGRSFSLSFEPLCAAVNDLSYVLVAIAAVAAALYVGRAFGGA